jgi:ADP-ribose pyrophosphatase
MKKTFQLLSETPVHQNDYFTVLDRHYRLPDGSEHHFFVNKEVDTCCVLALTKDRKFIAVKEFRVGPQKEMLELPAGRFEGFEDNANERIKSELLQETGYAGTFKKVGVMPTSPYSTRYIHCYYAIDCEKVSEQDLDSTEFIEVELLNISTMRSMLMNGESSSCAPGLLAWEMMKKDGYLPKNF